MPQLLDRPARDTSGVTLQISVRPSDLRHARHTLPHQLRQWAGQVSEVLLTLDLGRQPSPHPLEDRHGIDDLLATLCSRYSIARIVHVDYAVSVAREVSRRLCAGKPIPDRDCYGKAVYPYVFGLWAAADRYVLHVDSDMMFGGGNQTWVAEARHALSHPEVFSCSPFPGPPSPAPFAREVAIRHAGSRDPRALSRNAVPVSLPGLAGPALRFARMSTRNFMVDRSIFGDGIASVPVGRPRLRALLGAAAKGALGRGNPLRESAEVSLSRAMERLGRIRVDFLGAPPGMWSLHPTSRTTAYHHALPEIIRRVEAGEIPEHQRGDYDLNSSMIEESRARAV